MVDRNFLFAIALSFLVVMTYQTWRSKQQPTEAPPTQPEASAPVAPEGAPATGQVPESPPAEGAPAPAAAPTRDVTPEQRITIENELYRAELTSHGAGIASWQLKTYRSESAAGAPLIELAPGIPPAAPGLSTPLVELGLGDLGRAPFALVESDASHAVFALSRDGVTVRKRFDFVSDNYALRMRLEVQNDSTRPVDATFATRWSVIARPGSDFMTESLIALHEGSATREAVHGIGKPGFFSGGSAPETTTYAGDVDWAGVDSTYFLVAMVTPQRRDAVAAFEPGKEIGSASVWVGYPKSAIPPGLADAREYRLFAGPKEQSMLTAFGSSVESSVQLGWRWISPLTKGFVWLLHALYAVIPNYGVGIILLTLLVRVVTHPLNVRQMNSMKRMSELQPKVQELQKKYADDKQQQSAEMMKLYREAGVNPLGGCFPILLQFPVLMGLYYALQSSIDLRQAPFVGWIHDLSAPEALFTLPGLDLPVRLLPIVMGLSMVVQQKLTPSTMDPAQARMMMTIMPVMFTFMFYQLPSGLVLYWFVSNLLAIGSQVWIQRGQKTSPARS